MYHLFLLYTAGSVHVDQRTSAFTLPYCVSHYITLLPQLRLLKSGATHLLFGRLIRAVTMTDMESDVYSDTVNFSCNFFRKHRQPWSVLEAVLQKSTRMFF